MEAASPTGGLCTQNAADDDDDAALEDDAGGDGTDDNYSSKDKMEAAGPSKG